MFTEQVQTLFDIAKQDVWARDEVELTPQAVSAAVAQHPEGRVLLARCLELNVEKLRKQYPTPENREARQNAIGLNKDMQTVMAQAQKLAVQAPDRTHPGYVGLRHLTCALSMSRPACALFQAAPLSEPAALKQLTAWYELDSTIPELGTLTERLRALRTELLKQVFGQDHAVHAFIEGLFSLEISSYADSTRKGPQAVFIFAGPPGVGKTYLAELSAQRLGRPFQRFDMSSYSDHQSHLPLVGWPPSYQAARPGLLTDFVVRNPNAVLLFDEIEKSHLNIVNLFLQILDAGQLEDKFSAENVSFRDTIIVFTTNAGVSLYDHPNATGIHIANASFHRRTIMDALQTEKGPTGEPAFPPAICSRLASGYPVLFNHLSLNDLERIASAEITTVAGLLEEQYYKVITFDERLPLALVLREGAGADARIVRAQSSAFIRTELFKFSELFNWQRLQRIWEGVTVIHFGIEDAEVAKTELGALFEPVAKPRVLLIAGESLCQLYRQHIPEIEWLTANSTVDALRSLATNEVDLVVMDIWFGRNEATLSLTATEMQFDHPPLGAHTLMEGQLCLQLIHERLPQLPVYLLSVAVGQAGGTIDESLFLAVVRSGGARGLLTTAFTNDSEEQWVEWRGQFAQGLLAAARKLYREQKARALWQEHKVITFDSVPHIEYGQNQVTIHLRHLRSTRAVTAEDVGEILNEVERPTIRFADVFGAESAKEALRFIVDWLQHPRRYAALGVRPPRAILLTGLPGVGKTLLARSLAGESDAAFLVASGTQFVTIWQGSGPQNVRELFARARRYAPSIVFIDEIDAVGKKRLGIESGSRAEENTLNALLTEMDGFDAHALRPVILLAATNLGEQLDPALRRRFDREIEVPLPDREVRLAFLRHEWLEHQSSQVSEAALDSLAGRSAGMTIADLARLANEAAIMAAQHNAPVTDSILDEAFERMRLGETGKAPDAGTLERIARHEAGHALIGWAAGELPVQVSIIGRGDTGGHVERQTQEDKIIFNRSEIEQMICQAMGGRAAEIIYYGEVEGLSTSASGDLRYATKWAERMIREFGMNSEMGQTAIDDHYLRNGALSLRVFEAATGIVREQLQRALELLKANHDLLDLLSAELLSRNRLSGADVERLLGGQTRQPNAQKRRGSSDKSIRRNTKPASSDQ